MTTTFAVLLSGCGHQDGAEIHEATLTLWAIHRNGAEFQCFAPDIQQHHVLNHITGEEMDEERNVLIEAARIARGKIKPLSAYRPEEYDGLIIPGGVGVAKNLCTYAFEGINCTVTPEVGSAVTETHRLKKPIGALCIAPVLLAKLIPGAELTIGQDEQTAQAVVAMGGKHQSSWQGEIAIDEKNRLVTTPCYMLDSRVDQIGEGADRLVRAMLEMLTK